MNEFELIEHLLPHLATNDGVIAGAGDDCAVVQGPDPGNVLLFKTDAVVEGVHFTTDTAPKQIGHKALARCLSDIAAMGGVPLYAVVTLGLPPGFAPARVEAIYKGLNQLAVRFHVAVVGGETVTNPERMFLSVALIGRVEKERCVYRSGARPGDALFVTGQLGGSIAGRHLEFEPRVIEGRWLTEHYRPHAMIDLSDGLAGDLKHVLQASKVGAELLASSIPISPAARLRAKEPSGKPALAAALTDGEDFELLFAIGSRHAVPLLDDWKKQFAETRLTCIGKVTQAPGLRLRTKDGIRALAENGYVHFK